MNEWKTHLGDIKVNFCRRNFAFGENGFNLKKNQNRWKRQKFIRIHFKFFLQVTLVEAVIGKWSDIVNFLYLLLIWLHYINLGVMKVVFSLIWNLTLIKLRLNINWNLNRSVIWVEKDFSDYSKNIPPGKNPGARLFLRFKVVK